MLYHDTRWHPLLWMSLCLTLSLLLSACAGTPPVSVPLPPLPRARPLQAMTPCPAMLSTLPLDTRALPAQVPLRVVRELLGQVATAHLVDTDAYMRCRQKQAAEAAWISGSNP